MFVLLNNVKRNQNIVRRFGFDMLKMKRSKETSTLAPITSLTFIFLYVFSECCAFEVESPERSEDLQRIAGLSFLKKII